MHARNPRLEAQQLVGPGHDPRVLEPSPPAVVDGEWFADDPAVGGDLDWHEWVREHPEHAEWAADRWLAAFRPLGQIPRWLTETRHALHRLVVYVVSPARQRMSNGKMALRWTLGGIGTPFFAEDEQVRIAGTDLVRQRGPASSAAPITSLNEASAFVLNGAPDTGWAKGFGVPPAGDLDEHLPLEGEAARFLGNWYGLVWSVLEELRAEPESAEPSRVQLWPEHFDAAFDFLAKDGRATFGASPGDEAVDEPYLYVLPSGTVPRSDLWNACSFNGAVLPLSDLLGRADERAAALEFFRTRRAQLGS
jgi:hypothetical protein